MYARATTPPCLSRLIPTAAINWKHNKDWRFYGHSYTAPMPHEHTLQQLGLVTTKTYGLHLRNAARRMGTCPLNPDATNNPVPPGIDPIEIAPLDSDDNKSVVTFN